MSTLILLHPATNERLLLEITQSSRTALGASPQPDLIVQPDSVLFTPSNVSVGGRFTASFTIVNNGPGNAVATQARLRLTSDANLTSSDPGLSPLDVNIPAIAAGGSYHFSGTFAIPVGVEAGNYHVGVFADWDNRANQSDVTNDGRISSAFLTVNGTSIPAPTVAVQPSNQTVTAGDPVTFSAITTGTDPVFRWFVDGKSIVDSLPSNTLTLQTDSQLTTPRTWSVEVQVTNASGVTATAQATVTVNPKPAPTPTWPQPTPGQCTWKGVLDPNIPSVIITHGWQLPSQSSFNGLPPSWVAEMGDAISARLAASGGHANIIFFTWKDAYTINIKSADSYVDNQGAKLASEIKRILGNDYSKPIHFIGHSLGTFVNAFAVHLSPQLPTVQFTILDTAFAIPGRSPEFFYKSLRSPQVQWVDNYIATKKVSITPGVGLAIPGAAPNGGQMIDKDHTGIHDFYRDTIPVGAGDGGFNYSILLDGYNSRPAPEVWHPQNVTFASNVVGSIGTNLEVWSQTAPGIAVEVGNRFGNNVLKSYLHLIEKTASVIVGNARMPLAAISTASAGEDPGISAILSIPPDAITMAFEMMFSKPGDGDWVTITFNEVQLFTFRGDNFIGIDPQQFEVPVGAIAGQTGTLAVRLNTIGSANAEAYISDFKFLSRPAQLEQSLFNDDFDDNSIDPAKWTASGNTVTEASSTMQVLANVTDKTGILESKPFPINSRGLITLSRRVKVHYGNTYSMPRFGIRLSGLGEFSIHYANMTYSGGEAMAREGFFVARNGAWPHMVASQADVSARIVPVWDTWFKETITYDPATGSLEYYIDDSLRMTLNVGVLPLSETPTMTLHFSAWGWFTGHTQTFDDLLITQTAVAIPGIPVINSATTATTAATEPFTYTVTASHTPTSFNATGLPPGLSINTNTGVISGTPTQIGTFHITLTASNSAGVSEPAVLMLAVTADTAQTITFNALANRVAGAKFTLAATTTSGLPVSFKIIEGPAILGSDGKTVTIGATAGIVTIRATQAGGEHNGVLYAPAVSVDQSFEVTLGRPTTAQTTTFAQPAALTYGVAPLTLVASASSGLPVTFDLVSTIPATGVATLGSDKKTLTITGAGKITVRAVQPGAYPYKPAAPVTRTITVNKAPLAVSFDSADRLVRVANPIFPPSYSGFVNGDTAADLAATRPVGKTTAILASPEGKYPITFAGGLDANYSFVAGEPAFLTVEGFSGAYEALLVDDSGTARGKLELLVPNNALTFTGTLNLSSLPAAIPVRGNLSASDGASAQASWSPAASTGIIGLSLGFELTGDTLDGQLSFASASPSTLSIASGSRVFVQPVVSGKKQNSPWTGLHTLVLRDPIPLLESDTRALPLGAGHASVSVAASGVMTFKGKLADGTALTGTARPAFLSPDSESTDGLFRVFLRPYAKRLHSFLSGELTLVPHTEQQRFPNRFYVPETPGLLAWAKGPSPAKPLDPSYRAGFSATVSAALDPWLPPRAATTSAQAITLPERLGLLAPGSGTDAPFGLDFLGDFLTDSEVASLPSSLTLRANGLIVLPSPNPRSFQLSVAPATGALSGSFSLSNQVAPPPAKPVVRKASISGTLRQGPAGATAIGHAHYLLDPDPADSGPAANEQVSAELILSAPAATPGE